VQLALQGDYEKALADLGEAIRLDPKAAAESYHTRGRIYADQGRADAAISTAIRAGCDLMPGNHNVPGRKRFGDGALIR
jgi:tetratricopeptide (TPR) repeat protein